MLKRLHKDATLIVQYCSKDHPAALIPPVNLPGNPYSAT
jgi:hypothetical protein